MDNNNWPFAWVKGRLQWIWISLYQWWVLLARVLFVFCISATHRDFFCLELLGPLILDSHTLPGGTRSQVNTRGASTPVGFAPPPQRVTGNRHVVHICVGFQELHVCHTLLKVNIILTLPMYSPTILS